jgi:nicotinamidase/pyrazinamidase
MAEVEYDEHTALLVVDVQNDFADPKGSLYVQGGEDVVPIANREVARARAAGATVVYTRDWHPEQTPHFEKHGGKWPVHCVRDTWGAEFHPDLQVVGHQVYKATGLEDGYSGFSMEYLPTHETRDTGLEPYLRERGIEKVVVVGLATDYCVKETAIDAIGRGFDTTVLRDAIRAVDLVPGDGDRAIERMEHAGAKVR